MVINPLEPLLTDGVIDEVVARLKGGKEADVWLVRHAGEILAAKVYRSRQIRSFRNDAAYREGRQVRNSRTQRAMNRGSRFGRAAAEDDWKARESDALHRLHAAGVRVPRPVMFYEGVLLMEVVVDAQGHPAPRLVDAPLAPELAADLYRDLRRQVVGMLSCDLIHGDLSPFNVLVGWNGPVLIDFPQAIDAAQNQQAEAFLLRDLQNVHRFCASLDPALRAAAGDGAEIWQAYARRELTVDFVPSGRGVPRPAARSQRSGHPEAPRGGHAEGQHSPRHVPGPHHPARGQGKQGLDGQGGHGGQRRPDIRGRDTPRRPDTRARPTPEVVRVQRPPKGPSGPTAGGQGGAGSDRGEASGTQSARKGHRRRRRR
jgi:RIO kinase 1